MAPADDGLVAAGFRRLTPQSLRQRFFTDGVVDLDQVRLTKLVGLHPGEHVLLAFDVAGELAGGARLIPLADAPGVAELAITIDDRRQGTWLGPKLLDLLVEDAAELGIVSLRGHVLVENRAARSLVGRAGGHLWFDEPGVLGFEIPLAIDARLLDEAIGRALQNAS